jgi:hypothetical protein
LTFLFCLCIRNSIGKNTAAASAAVFDIGGFEMIWFVLGVTLVFTVLS